MSHADANAHGHEHNDLAHVASAKMLLGVFFALIVLTVLTVLAAGIGMGSIDLMIAMAIATVKATLVGLYFMHLRYDKPFNTLMFLCSFLFVAVFISFTMMDTSQYKEKVIWEEKGPENPPDAAPPVEVEGEAHAGH